MADLIFAKPSYLSEGEFAVLKQVALFVAMSEDSARYRYKLMEKTRHLPSFNFLRNPDAEADVIKANASYGASSRTPEQQRELYNLYSNYLTSYQHNKGQFLPSHKEQCSAFAASGGAGRKRSRSPRA